MKRDYGTLVPSRPSAEEAINHVPKKQRRVQGLEVVFDPHKHRDFITGFRKRKQQRRKEAQQSIKQKERQERLQQRAEKRTQLKQQLGLDDKWGVSSSDSDASDAEGKQQQQHATVPSQAATDSSQLAARPGMPPRETRVFKSSGMTTTVHIAPVSMHSSSEDESAGEGEEEEDQPQPVPAVSRGAGKKGAAPAGKGTGKSRGPTSNLNGKAKKANTKQPMKKAAKAKR